MTCAVFFESINAINSCGSEDILMLSPTTTNSALSMTRVSRCGTGVSNGCSYYLLPLKQPLLSTQLLCSVSCNLYEQREIRIFHLAAAVLGVCGAGWDSGRVTSPAAIVDRGRNWANTMETASSRRACPLVICQWRNRVICLHVAANARESRHPDWLSVIIDIQRTVTSSQPATHIVSKLCSIC